MDTSGSGLNAARSMKAAQKLKKGRARLNEIASRNGSTQPEWDVSDGGAIERDARNVILDHP